MKNLVITGGNEGIGYYMVKKWLEDGNRAAVIDLNIDNLEVLRDKYKEEILIFQCNVCDAESVKSAIDKTHDYFGTIDYAIHNACLCLFMDFISHSREDFENVLNVNYFGAVNLAKAVLPYMKEQKKGKIFFTSSGVGITGFINISSYASSKGALESLAKCLNNEFSETGITFHILHPPLTNTRSASPLPVPQEFKALPEKVGTGFIKNIDRKRFIITPSFSVSVSVRFSYLFSGFMGRMMVKMTRKAQNGKK